MRSTRCILIAILLCLSTFICKTDISQSIILERYTLVDGNTFEYDTGFLLLNGTFEVIPAADPSQAGQYGVIVNNNMSFAESAAASLTVNP